MTAEFGANAGADEADRVWRKALAEQAMHNRSVLRLELIKAALSSHDSSGRSFDVALTAIETADAVLWILDVEHGMTQEGKEIVNRQRHDRFARKFREAQELGL